MSALQFLAAITPVAAVFVLLVLMRLPATRAMPLSLSATALGAWVVWQVSPVRIAAAEGLAAWPFALAAGLCFTGSAWIVTRLFGPEFPTILGSIVGLLVMATCPRKNWLTPARVWDFHSTHADVPAVTQGRSSLWQIRFPYV